MDQLERDLLTLTQRVAVSESELDGIGRTLNRLDKTVERVEEKLDKRARDIDAKIDDRFDKLIATGWRIAGLFVAVLAVAFAAAQAI